MGRRGGLGGAWVRLGHSCPREEPGRPKESLRNRAARHLAGTAAGTRGGREGRGGGGGAGRAAHLQVGELLLLVGDGLLHQHALDALLHGVLLGLREKVLRSTGGSGLRGDGPSPASGFPLPQRPGQDTRSHLLEGLLLLRRQGRQSQLCGCALPVLHLDGVCPLVMGSREGIKDKFKTSLTRPQEPTPPPSPTTARGLQLSPLPGADTSSHRLSPT